MCLNSFSLSDYLHYDSRKYTTSISTLFIYTIEIYYTMLCVQNKISNIYGLFKRDTEKKFRYIIVYREN